MKLLVNSMNSRYYADGSVLSTGKVKGVLEADYFHEMLYLERKRSERSGKPSLLMLLNVRELFQASGENAFLRSFMSIFSDITRESDIKGWYERGHIIGIIFTEIGETDVYMARDRILRKVSDGLARLPGSENSGSIDISCELILSKQHVEPAPSCLLHVQLSTENSLSQSSSTRFSGYLSRLLRKEMVLACGDMLLISLAYFLSAWIRFGAPVNVFYEYTGAYAISLVLYPPALFVFDLYNLKRSFYSGQTVFRILLSVLLAAGASTTLFYFVPNYQYGRGAFAIQVVLTCAILIIWRIIYGSLFQVATGKIGTLILGAGESGKALYKLLSAPYSPYEVKGFLDDDPEKLGKEIGSPAVVGTLGQLSEIACKMGVRAAVLAIPRNRPFWLTRKTLMAKLQGMEILEMPAVYERLTERIPVESLEDQWLLFCDGFSLLSKDHVQKIKRVIDILFAGAMLITTAPLLILIALAICLDSPGPIFYRQERVGKGYKVFKVIKFRSMQVDAEKEGAVWAQRVDPRVTRIGRWIRIFRIDELPQILNVFKGDMSLVGPRPERPEFVKELESRIPYFSVRHTVSPGITGWAQVKYPYGASLEDARRKLEYDIYYLKNMSIFLDLKILLRTIGVVLLGEGAR